MSITIRRDLVQSRVDLKNEKDVHTTNVTWQCTEANLDKNAIFRCTWKSVQRLEVSKCKVNEPLATFTTHLESQFNGSHYASA